MKKWQQINWLTTLLNKEGHGATIIMADADKEETYHTHLVSSTKDNSALQDLQHAVRADIWG